MYKVAFTVLRLIESIQLAYTKDNRGCYLWSVYYGPGTMPCSRKVGEVTFYSNLKLRSK